LSAHQLLNQYVTNTDGQVFAIHGLEGIIGAVMARYSRAETGLRETLLREFIKEDKLKVNKAHKLIERVLIAYGDDSVGELEGAHLSFENISMLATKAIEHRRIGGSPIEQSTRYVRYDFRDPERGYHYHTPKDLPAVHLRTVYKQTMDRIFENYAAMWAKLMPYLKRRKPIEEAEYDLPMGRTYAEMATSKQKAVFERTYKNDLKTKTCDILRAFLPLATKANVGLFGNGRYFQHLISKMLSSPLEEVTDLGQQALTELSQIIPHYVKRAKRLDFLVQTTDSMKTLVQKHFSDLPPQAEAPIDLIEPDYHWQAQRLNDLGSVTPETLAEVQHEQSHHDYIAAMVYSFCRAPFQAIRRRLRELPQAVRDEIFDAYYGQRKTRRDRPERGIEHGYPYTFDIVTEWAVYKDLMRHRMATIQIQPMQPDLGFEMPPELEEAGAGTVARDTVKLAEDLFLTLSEKHPAAREYAMMQGHKVRWLIGINDRALMHMLELRTAPQGHPNYRKTCQQMHEAMRAVNPQRAAQLKFVNHEDTYWSRSDSEAKQRVKEAMLDEKD